jgi:hypothetical protein
MDANKHADQDPYIHFDEDGNPHIVTDNGTILYEYARTVSNTDDSDANSDSTNNGGRDTHAEHREM